MTQSKFDVLRKLIGDYGTARAELAASVHADSKSSAYQPTVTAKQDQVIELECALTICIGELREDPNVHNVEGQALIRKALAQSAANFELTTSYNGRTFNRNDVYMGDLSSFAQNLLTLAWSQK